MEFKKCFVPSCTNDSVNSPDKIFVKIREDLRKQWCDAANTEFFRIYTYYCCDDHFDPAKDLKNFDTYKEHKRNPVLKATAKFRYKTKPQPVTSPVKSASPPTSPERVSKEPESNQLEQEQMLVEDQQLLSVRKTKKRGSSTSITTTGKKRATTRMSDFSEACRCCLLTVGTMKPIFGSSLDVMLSDLMGCKVERNDGYPQQVCMRCIRRLSSAHNFYQIVKKSHKTVEEQCDVANIIEEPSEDFAIKNVEDGEINEKIKGKSVSVACQTEEELFQKLMLANVQLSRVERDGSHEMDDEYVMLLCDEQEDDEDLTVTKYDVREIKREPETYGYKCPQCLHVANNQAALTEHVKTHLKTQAAGAAGNRAENDADTATPAHLCNICGQTFKCRTSLYKHLRFHSGLVFECKYCDKQFAEQATLKVHLISHSLSNAKPFDCDACDRTFSQRAALNKHMRSMHAAQRAVHQCGQCDRSFLYKYSLQKHCLRNHTNSRCNICDSQFPGMIALEKHIKSHKENKPFAFEAEYLEFDDL